MKATFNRDLCLLCVHSNLAPGAAREEMGRVHFLLFGSKLPEAKLERAEASGVRKLKKELPSSRATLINTSRVVLITNVDAIMLY